MSQQNNFITKRDFDACDWQGIIEQCDQKKCQEYVGLFFAEAEKATNVKAQEVFALLGRIASLYFKLDNEQDPFGPLFVTSDGQSSFTVDDLTDEEAQVLTDVVLEVTDPEMQARIADVLYVKTRKAFLAGKAINAYLISALTLLNYPEHWISTEERIERALQLAAKIGKNNQDFFSRTIQTIKDLLEKYGEDDNTFFSAKLMKLLIEKPLDGPDLYTLYGNFSQNAAKRAETEQDWHRAREYWEIWGQWQRLRKVSGWKDLALRAQAETFLKEAESAVQASFPDYTKAAWNIRSAIETLQNVSNKQEQARIQYLYTILHEYQQKALTEMGRIEIPFDVTDDQDKARAQVAGKEFLQALFDLAYIGSLPRVQSLRKQAEKNAKQAVFSAFMWTELKDNNTGRTVGRRPPLFSNGSELNEQAIRAEMFRLAIWYQLLHAINWVEAARQQICLEHNIRVRDLLPLVSGNPFVPLGREIIYARGLHAGLTGDTLVATHLLIPQLENSIRFLLIRNGYITSKLDKEQIQDEFPLTKIFPTYQKELEGILGEDAVFDLRGLLTERFGSNLRNESSHGLMDHEEFLTPQAIYLWWLALRLCCSMMLPKSAQAKENNQQESTSDESSA